MRRPFIAACLVCASWVTGNAQTKSSPAQPLTGLIRQALSWLPSDTETIWVAAGPFAMPPFKEPDQENQDSGTPVTERLELAALDLYGLKHGLLQNYLAGQTVKLAIEGSRHFRPPAGEGEARYEGCEIALLAKSNSNRGAAFAEQSTSAALKTETVAGEAIREYQDKIDSDTWTLFVAFPKPNLVLACTNREYLSEVLQRVDGKVGPRALPDTLAEWKSVDLNAPFWALRHYDRSQAGRDPTSPFSDRSIIGIADRQAIGIGLSFDPVNRNLAKLTYFSAVSDILGFLQTKTPLSMHIAGMVDPSAKLPIRFRQTAPGVAEIEYELGGALSVDLFLPVVMAAFGHVVYM